MSIPTERKRGRITLFVTAIGLVAALATITGYTLRDFLSGPSPTAAPLVASPTPSSPDIPEFASPMDMTVHEIGYDPPSGFGGVQAIWEIPSDATTCTYVITLDTDPTKYRGEGCSDHHTDSLIVFYPEGVKTLMTVVLTTDVGAFVARAYLPPPATDTTDGGTTR